MTAQPIVPPCRTAVTLAGGSAAHEIVWVAPNDARSREVLAVWCDSVGPVVVESRADARSSSDMLTIVSWNAHVGSGDLLRLVADLRRGRFTGTPVTDFVLLLQEVFRAGSLVPATAPVGLDLPDRIAPSDPSRSRLDIVESARRLSLNVHFAPSMRNGDDRSREDRGNAILSTLPMSEPTVIELPFDGQRRVAVAATRRGQSTTGTTWAVRVVSVHLTTGPGRRRLWLTGGWSRTRQARGLIDALSDDPPTVLGTDLNTVSGPAEEAYSLMRRSFPDTPPPDAKTTLGAFMRLDYLFFRLPDEWRASYEIIEDSYGSDHRPLVGRVTFEAAPRGRR